MRLHYTTVVAYAISIFTGIVLIVPAIIGHYALFDLMSLRPLSTAVGAVWLMLVAISIQLSYALEDW